MRQLYLELEHPEMIQTNNKLVYTIGYEKRKIEDFLEILFTNKIKQVVDVRNNPLSKVKHYNKRYLQDELNNVGINYVHLMHIGTLSQLRSKLLSGKISLKEYLNHYREYILNRPELIESLIFHVSQKTSTLLCYESDWKKCHRSILSEILEKDGFTVIHL